VWVRGHLSSEWTGLYTKFTKRKQEKCQVRMHVAAPNSTIMNIRHDLAGFVQHQTIDPFQLQEGDTSMTCRTDLSGLRPAPDTGIADTSTPTGVL
jgi:hypothetical protein